MARMRAQDQTNYLGPLFVNPGGPGSSGTDFLFQQIATLVEQVGRGYDIVSWDPRGVGSTLPALCCFADPKSRVSALSQEEHLWLFQNDSTLDDLATRQQANAAGCQKYSSEVLPYIGTMANVRDLNMMNRLYGFSGDLTYLAPTAAGPNRQLDWSQFRIYVWNALKDPSTSWTGPGGFDRFLALLDNNQLNQLTAAAADALFKYIAQGNNEFTSTNTLVDPVSGLRNGGGNSAVIGAVDNPYSFGDIQSILPFLQSQRVTSTGYLVQSILGTRGVLNNYIQTPAERPLQPWANIETSYPLLFLSNIRDPLTPLQDARSNSAIFPGSIVLSTNASGHTTTFAGLNHCAQQAVFAYFNSDTLPAANTVCQPDTLPFNLDPQDPRRGAGAAQNGVSIDKLKRRVVRR
ncbi:MAG: hypothetical protein Q9196_005530 [Gyalolechia fulgens]